jgi:glycerol uptake facilitator-like aquaporin
MDRINKYIAEFIGTFLLTFGVLLSVSYGLALPTPVIAGLILGLLVYTIGGISGTHINPAITLGLLSIRKISAKDALMYIVFQFLGACLALILGHFLTPAHIQVINSWSIFFGETLGTFILAFGVSAVVMQESLSKMGGIIIGGSLLLGILFASPFSNGVLNPAVALGIGSFSLIYLISPIIGSVCGMQCMNYLQRKTKAN